MDGSRKSSKDERSVVVTLMEVKLWKGCKFSSAHTRHHVSRYHICRANGVKSRKKRKKKNRKNEFHSCIKCVAALCDAVIMLFVSFLDKKYKTMESTLGHAQFRNIYSGARRFRFPEFDVKQMNAWRSVVSPVFFFFFFVLVSTFDIFFSPFVIIRSCYAFNKQICFRWYFVQRTVKAYGVAALISNTHNNNNGMESGKKNGSIYFYMIFFPHCVNSLSTFFFSSPIPRDREREKKMHYLPILLDNNV